MKKIKVILSIVCVGLLINPIYTVFAQGNKEQQILPGKSNVEVIDKLNKEQAEDLLKINNPELDYIYQGDEQTFNALQEKGLNGYVFLPDVDGDIGYFVEKNTTEIYYFHPSGYLEKVIK